MTCEVEGPAIVKVPLAGCPRSRRRCETWEQRRSEAELSQYLSDKAFSLIEGPPY
jgi:hypothetical protein